LRKAEQSPHKREGFGSDCRWRESIVCVWRHMVSPLGHLVEIKEIGKKSFPFLFSVIAVLRIIAIIWRMGRSGLKMLCRLWGCCRRRALDDFVQLAAIQPDAPTLRAVVDFDSLPFRHFQIHGFANWAVHGGFPLKGVAAHAKSRSCFRSSRNRTGLAIYSLFSDP